MKKVSTIALATLIIFMVAGCNKENRDDDQSTGNAAVAEQIKPHECKVGLVYDSNGSLVPSKGVNLTQEMRVARLTKADQQFIIPVVFHVFGEPNGGTVIDRQFMEQVLEWINNDFHGKENLGDPETLYTIDPEREEYVGTIDMTFMLANFDPDGNPTDGIVKYPATHFANRAGLGNASNETYRAIQDISWDNHKYMNVYLTSDLYANNDPYNSGVAWLPDSQMTDDGTARVVYNINFLPGGNYHDPDFTSVITHEFGHFMNLHHTFNEDKWSFEHMLCNPNVHDGGANGDLVDDTPQTQASSSYPSYKFHGARNCLGEITDYGNFMNYGVYCNFTKGQVQRMIDGLNDQSRSNLWTRDNLIATIGAENLPNGDTPNPPTPPVTPPTPPTPVEPSENAENIKNGRTVVISKDDSILPNISNTYSAVTIYNRNGATVYSSKMYKGTYNMRSLPKGTYYYHIKDGSKIYEGSIEII